MKTLIISDVHSNIYALEAIWARESNSDLIICGGDLVDYGLYPREVIAWIREHRVLCVQGNHDRQVASCYRTGKPLDLLPLEERAWRHYNASLMSEAEISFLEQLPKTVTVTLDGISYGLSHMYRDYEMIFSSYAFQEFCAQAFPEFERGSISRVIFGHTHRQGMHYLSDTELWINPGSVSYRRLDDPDQTAHYLTITDGLIQLQRINYDISPLRKSMQQVSLSQHEMDMTGRFFGPRDN
ncbi:MAG: metallophosphoesterase [Chloroflexi bacterium]|nr:metallophosphoesterase [Chloroflexota bacterium]